MNKAKRFLALVLCAVFCCCFCPSAFAAEADAKIKITSLDVMPEEALTLDINMENNPGIMGMAFCVAYDKDSFEYIDYENGWLSGMTVKNHPDKGYVIFVYVATSDKTDNGKMLSVSFKAKQKAKPGNHKFVLGNNNYDKYGSRLHNSFSNSKQEFIVPVVTGGIVNVGETCINAGHKWSEWNITKPADCDETGLKNHTCTRDAALCIADERYEEVEIPITHDFEADWTVDEVATPEKDGVMTRHCKKCDATTDRITFSYEEVEGDTQTSKPQDNTNNSSNNDNNNNNQSQSKPPINNNLGDKNPIESVENLKDYQESIKPNQNGDTDTSEPETTQDSKPSALDDATSSTVEPSSNDKKAFSILKTPLGIVIVTVGSAIVCSIIALIITLMIIKRKKNK